MGMIMIVAGLFGGWRAGYFDVYGYAALAIFAAVLLGLVAVVFSQTPLGTIGVSDIPTLLVDWIVLFVYGAVPFTLAAWLKKTRIENRGE